MKPVLAILLLAVSASAQPRAINDAEREAVVIVASFLDRGPEALYERLAPDAPFRGLPHELAVQEIAARTGPPASTRWSLQTASRDVAFHVTYPSGYDDGLLFRMKCSGNRWMLYDVLTLAEQRSSAAPLPAPRTDWSKPLLIAALLLAVLAIIAWWKSRVLAVIAFLAAMGGVALAHFTPPESKPPLPFPELRALVPLREALARGDELALPRDLTPAARDVASLWILASGAALSVAGNTDDPLAGLQSAKQTPLAEIMRARLALAKDDRKAAQQAFRRALAIPPLRDDVALEAVTSNFFVNDPRFANSRDARWHYARRDLATAWRLRPVPREELVRDPDLLPLLRNPGVLSMVSYYGAEEPAPRSPSLGKSPIALPARSKTFACGELLRIELGEAILEVPGGAFLAPRGTQVVPATRWKQQDDAAALRDAQPLIEAFRGAGSQPVVEQASSRPLSREPAGWKPAVRPAGSRPHGGNRVRILRAAEALARHNRWRELLTITDSIPVTSSPELLLPSISALLRAGRANDARALAERMTPRTQKGRLAIGDAMTNIGAWDIAERLYGLDNAKERQQQLALRRELATNGIPIATAHFDIRHDPAMNPAIAARIGDLLEAELVRLQQKLPPLPPGTPPRRVTVNVVYWDAFRAGTGSDHILGLYTGEILFPFAVVNRFTPELVAIITHELTHALVAQATGDNAPRWFQEAVAQRFELVPVQENAFHDRAPESVLPVPLLDAVMDEATDEDSYRIALTFLRFLESRYGETSITKLIASFAEGKNSDEALFALTGKSLDGLNRDFRAWGFANSANFTSEERFPYGALYSPGVDPRIKAGFRFPGRE